MKAEEVKKAAEAKKAHKNAKEEARQAAEVKKAAEANAKDEAMKVEETTKATEATKVEGARKAEVSSHQARIESEKVLVAAPERPTISASDSSAITSSIADGTHASVIASRSGSFDLAAGASRSSSFERRPSETTLTDRVIEERANHHRMVCFPDLACFGCSR